MPRIVRAELDVDVGFACIRGRWKMYQPLFDLDVELVELVRPFVGRGQLVVVGLVDA